MEDERKDDESKTCNDGKGDFITHADKSELSARHSNAIIIIDSQGSLGQILALSHAGDSRSGVSSFRMRGESRHTRCSNHSYHINTRERRSCVCITFRLEKHDSKGSRGSLCGIRERGEKGEKALMTDSQFLFQGDDGTAESTPAISCLKPVSKSLARRNQKERERERRSHSLPSARNQ